MGVLGKQREQMLSAAAHRIVDRYSSKETVLFSDFGLQVGERMRVSVRMCVCV